MGEFSIFFRELDVPQLGESSQMGPKTSTDFLGPFWLASNWGTFNSRKKKIVSSPFKISGPKKVENTLRLRRGKLQV